MCEGEDLKGKKARQKKKRKPHKRRKNIDMNREEEKKETYESHRQICWMDIKRK